MRWLILAGLALQLLGTVPPVGADFDQLCEHEDCSGLVSLLQINVAVPPGGEAGAWEEEEVPHTRPVVPKDAAELTGVRGNRRGDFKAFVAGLSSNLMITAGCVAVFALLRLRYPAMYSNNVLTGEAPLKPEETFMGWLPASLQTSTDEAAASVGLDTALQLEFCNLCLKTLATMAAPLIAIGALNFIFGNGEARAMGDRFNSISMENVANGHPWLYYVHAAAVWLVVLIVQRRLYAAQAKFVERRSDWLRQLPLPRATTVLVEGIPEEFQSDEKVREFFARIFSPEQIKEVAVVKHAQDLEALVAARDAAADGKAQAEHQWELAGRDPEQRPRVLPLTLASGMPKLESLTAMPDLAALKDLGASALSGLSGPVDAIDYWTEQVEQLQEKVEAERQRVRQLAATVGGINSGSAFVTFSGRREAEIAKDLMYTPDGNEWIVSVPPEPSSVRWSDLRQNPQLRLFYAALGYAAVAGLYIGFMPICVAINTVSAKVKLPIGQSFWESFVPTIGLTVFLSFLPTAMNIIFSAFFVLKSEAWSQHKLQIWYFWFQVVFVILVTAVGGDFLGFAKSVAQSPFRLFGLLADELPKSTHFYQHYMVLQWSADAMALLRYVPLAKYLAFQAMYPEEEARRRAEPEDEDYYGIGSRSSRLAVAMLTAIIYSTLSPVIAVLGIVHFAMWRVLYGYLLVYAETKKPDLGGAFWVSKLNQVLAGLVLYCVLMTGVLGKRAPTPYPMYVAGAALVYTVWTYKHFQVAFNWEKLCFNELVLNEKAISSVDTKETYVQPVLQVAK